MYTKSVLASQLSELAVGDQFWFWCTSLADPAKIPLILQPVAEDQDMMEIKQLVEKNRSIGGIECLGLGKVFADGTLSLQAERISPLHASEIAMWTMGNRIGTPDLAILRAVRFVSQINGNKAMQFGYPESFQPAPLWGEEKTVKGRIQEYLAVLDDLQVSDEAWFALIDSGEVPQPHFMLLKSQEDPEMENFKNEFIRYCRQADPNSAPIVGMLKKIEGEKILLTPFNDADGWRTVIDDIIAAFGEKCPSVNALKKAEMFELRGEKLIAWDNPTRNASEQSTTAKKEHKLAAPLQSFASGTNIYFWFGRKGKKARLFLDADRKQLKAKTQSAPKMDQFTMGRLEANKNDGIDFIGRRAYPNFVNDIIDWYQQQTHSGELVKLHGARFIQRDADGKPVDRQRNPQAWNSIK